MHDLIQASPAILEHITLAPSARVSVHGQGWKSSHFSDPQEFEKLMEQAKSEFSQNNKDALKTTQDSLNRWACSD